MSISVFLLPGGRSASSIDGCQPAPVESDLREGKRGGTKHWVGGGTRKPTKSHHSTPECSPQEPTSVLGKERILYRQSMAEPCFVLLLRGLLKAHRKYWWRWWDLSDVWMFSAFVMEIGWIYVLYH